MYEKHFGFHRQPFQCAESLRTFFPSASVRRILPELLHSLRSDLGVAVVTGPAGVGRTTLLKHLRSLLLMDGRPVLCSGASLSTTAELRDTLRVALTQHQSDSEGAAGASSPDSGTGSSRHHILERLRRTAEFWGPVLLLIDDAQFVSSVVLNELRALGEEDWNGRSLIRCLISGPLSMEEELTRPDYADFSRRIRCHAFLEPLTVEESVLMLDQHLAAVGGDVSQLFLPEALQHLTFACDGSPRCLSLLTDECFILAAARGQKCVDVTCVGDALRKLQHLPYAWNIPATLEDDVFGETDRDDLNPRLSGASDSGFASQKNENFISGRVELPDSDVTRAPLAAGSVTAKTVTDEIDVCKDFLRTAAAAVSGPGFIEVGAVSPMQIQETVFSQLPTGLSEETEDELTDDQPEDFSDPAFFSGEVSGPDEDGFSTINEFTDASDTANFPEEDSFHREGAFPCLVTQDAVTEESNDLLAGFSAAVPVMDRYTGTSTGWHVHSPDDCWSGRYESAVDKFPSSLMRFGLISDSRILSARVRDEIPVSSVSDFEIAAMLSSACDEDILGGVLQISSPVHAVLAPGPVEITQSDVDRSDVSFSDVSDAEFSVSRPATELRTETTDPHCEDHDSVQHSEHADHPETERSTNARWIDGSMIYGTHAEESCEQYALNFEAAKVARETLFSERSELNLTVTDSVPSELSVSEATDDDALRRDSGSFGTLFTQLRKVRAAAERFPTSDP